MTDELLERARWKTGSTDDHSLVRALAERVRELEEAVQSRKRAEAELERLKDEHSNVVEQLEAQRDTEKAGYLREREKREQAEAEVKRLKDGLVEVGRLGGQLQNLSERAKRAEAARDKFAQEVQVLNALRAQVNVCTKHSEAIIGGADCWVCRAEQAVAALERVKRVATGCNRNGSVTSVSCADGRCVRCEIRRAIDGAGDE